jgi:hypothetical protein
VRFPQTARWYLLNTEAPSLTTPTLLLAPRAPGLTRHCFLSQVASALRPELLHVLARVVARKEANAGTLAAAAGDEDDHQAAALCRVLALAPHVAPLVARYFCVAHFPLFRAGEAPDAASRRRLAHGALHLSHSAATAGDAQLRRLVCSPEVHAHALRLLSCPDVHVRWAAVVLLARGLDLSPTQAETLRRRCFTEQEVRGHACRFITWLDHMQTREVTCRSWKRSFNGTMNALL